MSLTLRVLCDCRFLIPKLRFTSVNVRHLPRWTHRQPTGIIENEISKEEKEKWKLSVEREVGKRTSPSTELDDCNEFSNVMNQGLLNRNQVAQDKQTKQLNETRECLVRNVTANTDVDSIKVPDQLLADLDSIDQPIYKEQEAKLSSKTSLKIGSVNKTSGRKKKKVILHDQELKLTNAAMKLGIPVFIDLGKDDKVLSQYMLNLKSRKRREKVGKILLEGRRLIKDAICAGIVPEAVFFTRINDLKYLDLPQTGVKIYKLTYKEMCNWSDVTTPQGVIAVVKTPDVSKIKSSYIPLTVVCDNVRDPGNMGTIIRTCAGIGCQQIILTKGCVDLWDTKVLRSAAGAHFRISVKRDINWSEIKTHIPGNCRAFIAENNYFSKLNGVQYSSSEENNVEKTSQISVQNNNDKSSSHSDVPPTFKEDSNSVLPVVPYYACDFTGFSLVLVIGGETEGVSSNAYELVSRTGGVRLNIPLNNYVESLNVGVALGIIGFEIKRQLTVKSKICPDSETLVDSQVAVC